MMVELKSDLQDLVEKAWALHDGLSNEISNNSQSFLCRLCLEHGCNCNNAENPFHLERHRLIDIRDSLKEVENALMLLHRIRSRQLIDRHAALTRLEESRSHLVEKVTQYQGRLLDVANELNACFDINGKSSSASEYWNSNEEMKNEAEYSNAGKRRITSFLMCCTRMLFNPWNWRKAIGFAAKLFVVSASISSTVTFCHARCCNSSQRKVVSFLENRSDAQTKDSSPSNAPPDVCCGRG